MAESAPDQFADFFPAHAAGAGQGGGADPWADFKPQAAPQQATAPVPDYLTHRLYLGLLGATEGAKEGFGQEKIGLSDEEARKAMEAGLFYDKAAGNEPKWWQKYAEAAVRGTTFGADLTARSINSAVYAGGGALGEAFNDPKLRNEAINLANFLMIEGGNGSLSRVHPDARSPVPQVIGPLPKAEDFANAAAVIADKPAVAPPWSEAAVTANTVQENLHDLWQERAILPAEAAHDANGDAFLKQELRRPPANPPDHSGIPHSQNSPVPEGTPRSQLALTGESPVDNIVGTPAVRKAIDNPAINRANDVPGGAAADIVGNGLNVDRRLPESITVDGTTFDPSEPLAVREFVGREATERLVADGTPRVEADKIAETEFAAKAEAAWYEAHDIDQTKADAIIRPAIEAIDKEIAPENLPPHLYPRPPQEETPPAIEMKARTSRGPGAKDSDKYSLFEFLAKGGGIADTPDTRVIFSGQNPFIPGFGPLLRKTGKSADRALEAAIEAGYIFDPAKVSGGVSDVYPADLYRLMDEEARGKKQYRIGTEPPEKKIDIDEQRHRINQAIDSELERQQQKPEEMPDVLRNRIAEIMEREGVTDPGNAWEQAVMEAHNHAIEAGEVETPIEHVPGWDVGFPDERGATPGHGDAIAGGGQPFGGGFGDAARSVGRDYREPIQEAESSIAHPLGADVAGPLPTLTEQPPLPPGRLLAGAQKALGALFDIGRDIQMKLTPMATGSKDAMRLAKDFANTMRRNRWQWAQIDEDIKRRFEPEQRERMWNAADEESVARQLKESTEHQGLTTLTTEESAAVEMLQERAQLAWVKARELGMVEGEGLPAYTPRMIVNAGEMTTGDGAVPLNSLGTNLRVRTAQMLHREHMTAEETEAAAKAKLGAGAEIVRDIRVLPMATARLEDAIAGRTLIDRIKDYGKSTGEEVVAEGFHPQDSSQRWFTIDNPAFKTWRPRFSTDEVTGKTVALRDAEGSAIFEQVPIYVRGDFEGPLRAVLRERKGAQGYVGSVYAGLMAAKGKAMSLVMYSPIIHNAVEWGRALPAMPGKVASFKVYFEGNLAKNNPAIMREAIDAGLVPIGHRFFNQDLTSMIEEPSLTPGRSFTSKVLGFIPGLFDPAKEVAVRAAIDKAGDFWHNTLLWDRVGDLQMGLYTNFRDEMVAKGADPQTAARAAAHWANRYAGALPQEAMSEAAQKFANLAFFSRTFTFGNLGVMKDAFSHLGPKVWNPITDLAGRPDLQMAEAGGLPRDVAAQIEHEQGAVGAETVRATRSLALRKAMAIVALDMGLFYAGNSIIQSALNVIRGDDSAGEELRRYADRMHDAVTKRIEHPLSILQPFDFLQSVSSTSENEPGRQDRIRVGYAADGTAIYARNPVGKIGEEFIGWPTGFLDMIRRKLGTVARPIWAILSNDRGFGRKVYDPDADMPLKYAKNVAAIAWEFMRSNIPEGAINASSDLVTGQGNAGVNALQALGPVAGVTFSKGAPGGPAVGELYHARQQHEFAVNSALPGIRRQIQNGDLLGAIQKMNELGVPQGLQRFYVKTTLDPTTRLSGRSLRDFYLYATPEQRARMERATGQTP